MFVTRAADEYTAKANYADLPARAQRQEVFHFRVRLFAVYFSENLPCARIFS